MSDENDEGIRSRQTQEKLRASEVRYRRLFETAKDGILILDADTGRITDVNPFLQDMVGYSHNELIGKALWEIGPVKDIVASQDAMCDLQEKEYIRYENLPLETKAGQQIQVEFVSNVYRVDGRRVIQCNVRDITTRKRAEAGMRTANDELMASVAELKKRDEEMKSLIRLNDLLQSCTTQAESYLAITHGAVELFAGQSGCLAILNAPDHQFETVARWGDETVLKSSFSWEDCWALRRGQLHEVIDQQADLTCRHFVHQPGIGHLCVPLTLQGEITGLLCLIRDGASGDKHRVSERQLAVTVGETIILSLSNLQMREKLRQETIHDPLTGLFNRRYLDESLLRELDRAKRRNSPLCVAMLDLDNFKPYNDTFGHDAGDKLLHELARALRDNLRKSDISCRYGGDEFVLVLPDSSLADTCQRMKQICVLVKELWIRQGGRLPGAITLSAGVAGAPEHGSTATELLQAADNAMYAAKQAGGDRVVGYHIRS